MLTLRRAKLVKGELRVPSDKSVSHRAVMISSLAKGKSLIKDWLVSEDTLASLNAMRALGVSIERKNTELIVEGRDYLLEEPNDLIDAKNSGTTARLLMGILSTQEFFSVITGDSSLRNRPMLRVVEPLRSMGAFLDGRERGNKLPIAVRGGKLRGIAFFNKKASAQVKSALLLAGLKAVGFLSLQPYFRYHSFTDADVGTTNTRSAFFTTYNGTSTYSYTTYKYGVKVATDPLGIPFKPSLEGVYARRLTTDIQEHNNSTGADTQRPDEEESFYRLGLTLNEFLVPGASLKVAYASYRGTNVVDPAGGFLTRGYGDFSLSATTDRLFTYPGEVLFPWNLTTGAGTRSGGVDGIYVEAKYYNFTVAYLDAILLDGTGAFQSYGRAFKVSYNVGF